MMEADKQVLFTDGFIHAHKRVRARALSQFYLGLVLLGWEPA
jgi:hypothetical protein